MIIIEKSENIVNISFLFYWCRLFNILPCQKLSTSGYHQKQTINNPESPEKANSIYDFSALDINGNTVNLSKYHGLVTYIVNVASE